ncbi:hypothetical protein ZWY2020_057554 [Hordeum vulgare]|nr:hypothetical protein ZWY2020_057554 [Hordeum vulgare]
MAQSSRGRPPVHPLPRLQVAEYPSVFASPRSRIPAELIGCCYNCGDDGHISAICTNKTMCVWCVWLPGRAPPCAVGSPCADVPLRAIGFDCAGGTLAFHRRLRVD